ncbi:DUF4276 family protein [Nannocystis pusilla]|uniref:DUF4276 family protein n=1 Tax=Nannocystis pusilla TaxID=889268 RepID=A0ABS7U2S6_9BACT|nr:DUF4276 family protein [Nannocystis pusilla]MBZ5714655.1 DUF4276 family protein [Nannocystis pusilla]
MPAFLVVEGHGELEAAHNLLVRLTQDLGYALHWSQPRRFPNLHLERGIRKAAEVIRVQQNVDALLILRDEDDRCPAKTGPELASWLRALRLPFPAAAVMFCREYETLFLPCAHLMAGKPLRGNATERPGLVAGTRFEGDPEAIRGAKEWLSRHFPKGSSYKPTLDQLPMTRMLSFDRLRECRLPCFGTLERALAFLVDSRGCGGAVYPLDAG